jgi:hypothetical protein
VRCKHHVITLPIEAVLDLNKLPCGLCLLPMGRAPFREFYCERLSLCCSTG